MSPFFPNSSSDKVDCKLNETFLNEGLVNLTIAAISLNLWHDVVDGNVTCLYNVYRLEHRLNFFLPYGLYMLLTVPIITLGLLALRHNGDSAIEGGFLQILMTAATGNAAIERAARSGCFGGRENMPEELEKLKVASMS